MTEYALTPSPALHVVHDGPPTAPPLLLIHGSGAAGSTWAPMIPALATRHHVIRVDLPGCGQSPPARSYAVPDQARQVAAVLDELGLGQIVVAGHSSGGYVATSLAEQRPDLVAGITLISTGPRMDALLPPPLILRVLTAPPIGPLLWSLRSDAMTRTGIGATAAGPVTISDEVVADLKRIPYGTFRTVLRENSTYIENRDVPTRLAAVGRPTLVIFGGADPRWNPASARQYDMVPNTRIELLPGVGHLPMLESPERTGDLLLGFTAPAEA
jgi:pimeloyl-ACP methyl ester carboxylesterase